MGGTDTMYDMDDDQFTLWQALLKQRIGMMMPYERKSFLVTNLGIRMREIGCSDYQEYYDLLHSGRSGSVEWSLLVDRLTVHETRFFRHKSSLSFISKYFLPEWVERAAEPYTVNVWSVGCATGEEPYTLAIVIDQYMKEKNIESYMGIIASDISLTSIAVGRRGVYHERKLREMDSEARDTYMTRVGEKQYQVNKDMRQRICFTYMNVLEIGKAPVGKMDLIYCQNLLIYFDQERRNKIINGLTEHLLPGGIIVLGSGEVLGWQHPELEKIPYEKILAYRRKSVNDNEANQSVQGLRA